MDTLFLFVKHIDASSWYCLKLNPEGTLIVPYEKRTFAEIKKLQNECSTLVIESSEQASLFNLELTWLPERKARVAIPYALEDKLAQPVDELHFAFDRAHYQNNQYLITVISKNRIRYLIQVLCEYEIEFAGITLDWFALAPNQICFNETTLLINTNEFKGALKGELVDIYLKEHAQQDAPLVKDSHITDAHASSPEECSAVWIAQRIMNAKLMNLCQGEMEQGNRDNLLKKGYLTLTALFCFWLISLLLVNAIYLNRLNNQTQNIDDQIAVIYHDFFPDAKKVISPKFRIEQLLKGNNREEQNRFWFLLDNFSKVIKSDRITLEQLRFQNKTLSVTIISNDFSSLEELENELKKHQLSVKQTHASTHEQHVVATLELT